MMKAVEEQAKVSSCALPLVAFSSTHGLSQSGGPPLSGMLPQPAAPMAPPTFPLSLFFLRRSVRPRSTPNRLPATRTVGGGRATASR